MAGTSFKQRRGTAQLWQTTNVILLEGELGYETDTGRIKFGDGVTRWNALPVAMRSDYLPILGKAADSDKLDGFDSTVFTKVDDAEAAYLKKTDAANTYLRSDAPTSAATVNAVAKRDAQGKVAFSEVTLNTQTASSSAARKDYVDNTDTNRKTYVDGLVTPTGASRTLVNHFASVTAFPTVGVKVGDRCFRTDLGCEMFWSGGSWRQTAPSLGTAASRLAIPKTNPPLYNGFLWQETDTGFLMRWNGTDWTYFGPELHGTAALTLGTTAPPIGSPTQGTTASITVPPNSRLHCEAKIQLNLQNTNPQSYGWGKPWGVTLGSTIVAQTYEHGQAGSLESNLWSRALIDTGSNTRVTITMQWTSGSGNNGMTLAQPEFFYHIGASAP